MLHLLSPTSLAVIFLDIFHIQRKVASNKKHILAGLGWLKHAQDMVSDGGIPAYFRLDSGWTPSFIETTGYIIGTFLECSSYFHDLELRKRAILMGDFLLKMQLPSGGFRSKTPSDNKYSLPIVFDTGQVILGLCDLYKETKYKKYLDSAIKGANFLINSQNSYGSWSKYNYKNKSHTYDVRIAWSLLRVFEMTEDKRYRQSAERLLSWAKGKQLSNGWFIDNNFPPPNPDIPYTHTISYAIEGFLYSGILLNNEIYINIAKKAADKILEYYARYDFLPGTLDKNWESSDKYSCLTGDAQISIVWMKLFEIFGKRSYLEYAKKINMYLKSSQDIYSSSLYVRGGIKGSLPVYGDLLKRRGYCRMAYLNWATKFFIDSLLYEMKLKFKKNV